MTKTKFDFPVEPIEGDHEIGISFIVMDKNKTQIQPEFRLDFDDPYNRSYLEKYVLDDQFIVQFREYHSFYCHDPRFGIAICKSYPDALFRFTEFSLSVESAKTSEDFIELLEWDINWEQDEDEDDDEDDLSFFGYDFILYKVLSKEDSDKILSAIGFTPDEISGNIVHRYKAQNQNSRHSILH